jgi:hypothetical protein
MVQIPSQIQCAKLAAIHELERARFLLRSTYPQVQEQKLFLEVFKILVLYYDKLEKFFIQLLQTRKIVSKELQNEVLIQKTLLAYEDNLNIILGHDFNLALLIRQKSLLQDLLKAQKLGPADFRRKKDYIICENNYKVRVINESSTLKFLTIAEKFERILTKTCI